MFLYRAYPIPFGTSPASGEEIKRMDNWKRAQEGAALDKIEPLK